jgi:hypothetical protein
MFYLIVIERVIGPINMLVCGTCLLLMFFESAFGICIGCKLHNWLRPEQAQLCPGGACAYTPPAGAGGQWGHALVLVLFIGVIVGANHFVAQGPSLRGMHHPTLHGAPNNEPAANEEGRCQVPAFAKAMGHETIWKQHNGCL